MLTHGAECRRVLIAGDGDGRFLEAFLRVNPMATIDSIDISPAMLDLAKRRIAGIPGATERVQFHCADVRHDPLPGTGYDLIVTNFLLDCFPTDELDTVIRRLSDAASQYGKWIVGDFAMPRRRIFRPIARVLLGGMYTFFRITTRIPARSLVDPSPYLRDRGWTVTTESPRLGGFLLSRLWQRSWKDS